ncbi:MAG: phytase [Gammaproteobacteria bacterium]|nr:phytase [Gammaproteobacteria bacterium]
MDGRGLVRPWLAVVTLLATMLGGCDAVNDVFVCSVEAAFRAGTSSAPPPADAVTVPAHVETEPVADPCDAADDPAVWVNPDAPAASLIVATNKRRGLAVYGLDGGLLAQFDVGQTNNVDLRSMPLSPGQAEEAVALVAASNRSSDTVDILHLFANGRLVPQRAIPAGFDGESPYGLCLYQGPASLYAIATYKDGAVRQWRLAASADSLVRTLRVSSQVEGCVADDPAGALFVGEEDAGIWRFDAEPDGTTAPILVGAMREAGGHLVADVEGLAIHASSGSAESGYLVASSQGNSSFILYDRSPPHSYRGSFRIGAGGVDEVTDTDGIAIASTSLGARFPTGLLVAQDGDNQGPAGESQHQNFKLIPWHKVTSTVGAH